KQALAADDRGGYRGVRLHQIRLLTSQGFNKIHPLLASDLLQIPEKLCRADVSKRIRHTDFTLPFGIEKIVKASGKLRGFDQLGVVQYPDRSHPPGGELAVPVFKLCWKTLRRRSDIFAKNILLFQQEQCAAGAGHDVEARP